MQQNTEGLGNSGIGFASLSSNKTGTGNTAVGFVSMPTSEFGSNNTAVGNHSAYYLDGGSDNVMIGAGAGMRQEDGIAGLVSPENSIYIGANSRGKDDQDSNSIVIGGYAIGEGSNTTVIGNSSTSRARIFGVIDAPGGLKVGGDTVLEGNVTLVAPQGDISMGIYE